jgi:hypothetical protein
VRLEEWRISTGSTYAAIGRLCGVDRAIVQWLPDGSTVTIAQFSGHWAACAAMIRLTQPGFVSLGGDRADDLAIEAAMVLSA